MPIGERSNLIAQEGNEMAVPNTYSDIDVIERKEAIPTFTSEMPGKQTSTCLASAQAVVPARLTLVANSDDQQG